MKLRGWAWRTDQHGDWSTDEAGRSLVVPTPELAHHVPQGEDGAEDELGIILGAQPLGRPLRRARGRRAAALGRGRGALLRRGRHNRGQPAFLVDALRWDAATRSAATSLTSSPGGPQLFSGPHGQWG